MQRSFAGVSRSPDAAPARSERGPVIPGNLVAAWEGARRELQGPGVAAVLAEKAGGEVVPDGVRLSFLKDTYLVDVVRRDVRHVCGPSGEPDVVLKTLLCHYLSRADGRAQEGLLTSFREFPGAQIYYGPFVARTVRPLVSYYGHDPHRLIGAGVYLGGSRAALGDAAVTLPVLPRLPLTAAVWSGDSEVAASGSILFDRSAIGYLPLEDLVVAAQRTVQELIRAAQHLEEVSG